LPAGREEGTHLAFQNPLNRLIQIEANNTQMVFHICLVRSGDPVHVGRLDGCIQSLLVLGDPPVVRGLLVLCRFVPRVALGHLQSHSMASSTVSLFTWDFLLGASGTACVSKMRLCDVGKVFQMKLTWVPAAMHMMRILNFFQNVVRDLLRVEGQSPVLDNAGSVAT
jgi:hypothetical protein